VIWLALVAAAYLLGAVSWSLLIVRAFEGFDIRTVGSGNAGATNVLRNVGAAPAVAVLALDVAKGVVPVLTARALQAPGAVVGAAAVAAVVGHVFPVYHSFRGGKGVATAAGAMGALALGPALLAAVAFALVVAATRYVSLASMTAVGLFPLLIFAAGSAGWIAPPPAWLLASAAAVALLVIAAHHQNIRRLLAGTEEPLGRGTSDHGTPDREAPEPGTPEPGTPDRGTPDRSGGGAG
jgi:glycerol-3-phosphate acyltransferase PlsY